MIADLHCHYPMHLLEDVQPTVALEPPTMHDHILSTDRPRWLERLRARVFRRAGRSINHPDRAARPDGGWRLDLDGLEAGGFRLVLSVLYDPLAELDLDEKAGLDPKRDYYDELQELRGAVERGLDPNRTVVVTSTADLERAEHEGKIAFVHCVEGGFHLGRRRGPIPIDERVEELAGAGVAYVTLAHLFYRGVATNAPALPFVPDRVYNLVAGWWGPPWGLSRKGRRIVRAMYRHRVLVDLSHMRGNSVRATLRLLDRLDPDREMPVIASHAGFRFGKQTYMLSRGQVEQVAARDGVIGLILARHQLEDGLDGGETLEHTVEVVCKHARKIRDITGSDRYVGIGSDLDGFIHPTMAGVEEAAALADFEGLFRKRYEGDADAILHGNAARVISRVFELRAT